MKIHHLNCGSVRRIEATYEGLPPAHAVNHCLLVETDRDGLVLVETGLGLDDVRDPGATLGAAWVGMSQPVLAEEETAVRQVVRLGYSPADVRHVIVTHLDVDHCGGLPDFPDAAVHVLAAELDAAMAEVPSFRPPAWLATAPVACRLTAATLAAVYGGAELAARLFVSAARDGAPRRQFWLARAALAHFDDGRPDQGRALMADLEAMDPLTEPFARVLAAFLAEDWPRLRVELAAWSPRDVLETAIHYSLAVREVGFGRGEELLSREALDEVIDLSRRVLDSVWVGTVALAHAHHLIMRVERAESVHRHADLNEALALAVRARDELRFCRADSVGAAALACQAAEAAGDFRAVLALGTAGPQGATAAEAASPQVRKYVVLARTWLGDPPNDVTVDDMGEPHLVAAMKAVIADQRGEDPVPHWRQAAELASEDAHLARALLGLARSGEVDLPRLDELAERVPEIAREIRAAADLKTGNRARGIATLRVLARTSYSAASMLAGAHTQDGDVDALVEVLRQAAEDFSDPQLRLEAVSELRKAGRAQEAEHELSALLTAAPPGWAGVRDAQRLAAQIAVDDGRLEQAVELLRTVVNADPDSVPTRWALIDLLFRRAETSTAWRVYREHRDGLDPAGPREAHLWIDLHRWFGDPMDTLRGCLLLARRFSDSETVVAHALTALLMMPRLDAPVPDDMADAWRETTEEFFRRWPTSRWLRRIDVEHVVEELNTRARISPELRRAIHDSFTQAVLGRAPLGAWAQLTSQRYSEVVLGRGMGVLPATHPDRREQMVCLTTATLTAGSGVVLDTTAIVVLNTLPAAVRDLALGLFGVVMTADAVLLDARLADEMLSRRSTARWQWNENTDENTEAGGSVGTEQRHADRLAEESTRLVVAVEYLARRSSAAFRSVCRWLPAAC
ncbi:MBL fold metallo-hydrolase [Saccharothrix deserti]|uniref:MBL fold metallo-hydrolase n=1 Tax=Saccharothrix deserti TaxID=2593674 RepID=UPI001EE43472|nr:MBL fold metallo-hydrolase [Saccharothrix deserti]